VIETETTEDLDETEIDLLDVMATDLLDETEIDPLERAETDPVSPESLERVESNEPESPELLVREESLENTELPERIDLPERDERTEDPSLDNPSRTETRRSITERFRMLPMTERPTSELMIATLELAETEPRTRREVPEVLTGDLRPTPRRSWPLRVKSRRTLLPMPRTSLLWRLLLRERLLLSPPFPRRRSSLLPSTESNESSHSPLFPPSPLPVLLEKESTTRRRTSGPPRL